MGYRSHLPAFHTIDGRLEHSTRTEDPLQDVRLGNTFSGIDGRAREGMKHIRTEPADMTMCELLQ